MKNVYRIIISITIISWFVTVPIRATTLNTVEIMSWESNAQVDQDNNLDLDKTKPTLKAAINDGVLNIQAIDSDSGIAAIYVNSNEYTKLNNDSLNITLQQFDAGYQYFTLQAKDKAGNASDIYKLKNPYYIDATEENDNKNSIENSEGLLPLSALPTNPTDAKGTVVGVAAGEGKEFYTIQTKSEKVFYLIIDKSQKENSVYLLTEVSENDLLNFSDDKTEVLPQNSAVVESAVPISNSASVNEKSSGSTKSSVNSNENAEPDQGTDDGTTNNTEAKPVKPSNKGNYIMITIVVLMVGGVGYYTKFIKGKKGRFDDEEFEEDEEDESEVVEDDEEYEE